MPIKGAVTTAALINVPWGAPTTGNSFQTEKTTYIAAKEAVKAMFLVDGNCDFKMPVRFWKALFFKYQSSNEETISQGSLK